MADPSPSSGNSRAEKFKAASIRGEQAYSVEARADAEILERISVSLSTDALKVSGELGFGSVPKEIIRLSNEHHIDVLVMGAHGHRGFLDFFYGTTISPVRHSLKMPIVIVR